MFPKLSFRDASGHILLSTFPSLLLELAMPKRSRQSDSESDDSSSDSSDSSRSSSSSSSSTSSRSSASTDTSRSASKSNNAGGTGNLKTALKGRVPGPPPEYRCPVCRSLGQHWVIECPAVLENPRRFRQIDTVRGCLSCGMSGHTALGCPLRKKCRDCGGSHDVSECPFNRKPVEWHEFFDEASKRVYYYSPADEKTTWDPPAVIDKVLWCCDPCNALLPTSTAKCVTCGWPRPKDQKASKQA